ncbi:MAG: hypothetical protein LBO78_01775, partial [Rickettsiales bacterium]|nr:hypothetical protein [Rickettsiales bacterium]
SSDLLKEAKKAYGRCHTAVSNMAARNRDYKAYVDSSLSDLEDPLPAKAADAAKDDAADAAKDDAADAAKAADVVPASVPSGAPGNARTLNDVKVRKKKMSAAVPYIAETASTCESAIDEGKLDDLQGKITAGGWMSGVSAAGGVATVIGSSMALFRDGDNARKQKNDRLIATIGSGVSAGTSSVALATNLIGKGELEELRDEYGKCISALDGIRIDGWQCVANDAVGASCSNNAAFD